MSIRATSYDDDGRRPIFAQILSTCTRVALRSGHMPLVSYQFLVEGWVETQIENGKSGESLALMIGNGLACESLADTRFSFIIHEEDMFSSPVYHFPFSMIPLNLKRVTHEPDMHFGYDESNGLLLQFYRKEPWAIGNKGPWGYAGLSLYDIPEKMWHWTRDFSEDKM